VFNFFDGAVIDRQVQVVTVAERKGPLAACGGLHVMESHDFHTCPPIDLLFVPGASPGNDRRQRSLSSLPAPHGGAQPLYRAVCSSLS
jgi:hypothetical protein